MVDGSSLSVADNIQFTKRVVEAAKSKQIITEAELGRLSGTEDGLTIEEYEAHLTDVHQVRMHSILCLHPVLTKNSHAEKI